MQPDSSVLGFGFQLDSQDITIAQIGECLHFFHSYLKMWISLFEFWSLCICSEPYHLSVVLQLLCDIFHTIFYGICKVARILDR